MEGVAEVGGCHLTAIYIITITLVDDNTVGDLHDATLDALKLITRTGYLDEQEEIDHRVTGGLTLSDTNRLYEDLIETGSLTEDDGLTRLTRHTA